MLTSAKLGFTCIRKELNYFVLHLLAVKLLEGFFQVRPFGIL